MAFVDGTNLRITLSDDGGTTTEFLFHAQQADLQLQVDTNQIITKDTGGGNSWAEVFPKQKSGTLTANGLIDYGISAGTNISVEELFDYLDNATEIDWEFTTGTTGDPVFSGKGYITALNQSAQADTESSWDITISVNGTVTKGTVV